MKNQVLQMYGDTSDINVTKELPERFRTQPICRVQLPIAHHQITQNKWSPRIILKQTFKSYGKENEHF
jgi:hypothetical protein